MIVMSGSREEFRGKCFNCRHLDARLEEVEEAKNNNIIIRLIKRISHLF